VGFVYPTDGEKAMMDRQTWGWLMVGVLAAGLNAAYHDGAGEWAHRIVDGVQYRSEVIVATAQGTADRFLSEAHVLSARNEAHSCRVAAAIARLQSKFAREQAGFESRSAREQAQVARVEAQRARIEARSQRVAVITTAFESRPVPVCARVRVSIPRMPAMPQMPAMPTIKMPAIKIPAPVIDVELNSGPI
jgi:hypothetical protein